MAYRNPYFSYSGYYPRYYEQQHVTGDEYEPQYRIDYNKDEYPVYDLQTARSDLINSIKGVGWSHSPIVLQLLPRLGISSPYGQGNQSAVAGPPEQGGKFYHISKSGMDAYLEHFGFESTAGTPVIRRRPGKRDHFGKLLRDGAASSGTASPATSASASPQTAQGRQVLWSKESSRGTDEEIGRAHV